MLIDNRVRVAADDLPRVAADELCGKFIHPNPEHATWLRFRRGYEPRSFVATWRREKWVELDMGALAGNWLTFPRGGLKRVLDRLAAHGIAPDVLDRRTLGESRLRVEPGPLGELADGQQLRPHQLRLVSALERHEQLLWRSPTASGKTVAVLGAAARLGVPTLVVAPTSAIFDQWLLATRKFLGIEAGVIRGGVRNIGRVTIAMQQTLWKCAEEVAPYFGFVAFDEVQQAAARTVQETVDAFPARYRLGVSDDERRADEREFLTYDMFGEQSERVSRDELIASGAIVEVAVRVVPTSFAAPWYTTLDESKLRLKDRAILDSVDRARAARHRAKLIAQQKFEQRPQLIAKMANDEQRNELVAWCAQQAIADGEQMLVLTERVEHCTLLESRLNALAPCCRLSGDEDDALFESNRDRFASGEFRLAVGTFKKVGVGFESHRALARGCIASTVVHRDESEMQLRQYLGRFARAAEGKRRGIVYMLHDSLVYGDEAVRLLARWLSDVRVLSGDEWVSAREYLKARKRDGQETKRSRRAEDDDAGDDGDGLFAGWRR